ncbi:MAG: RidA family protein [Planctomycetota bacterium]|jgi:enamine deaminase RidA (YjgF/YER057c/UK114 family)
MPDLCPAEQKLIELGYPLDEVPKPGATYTPVTVNGTTAYVSGTMPFDGNNVSQSHGKVPSQVSLEEAQVAAALCAANILRIFRQELGSLDLIDSVLRLTGYVNTDPDFTDHHLVINGASQLMLDVLGDAGWHARTALGMAQLPGGSSVEVEAIFKLKQPLEP